jgi:type II secretory pathway component PulC
MIKSRRFEVISLMAAYTGLLFVFGFLLVSMDTFRLPNMVNPIFKFDSQLTKVKETTRHQLVVYNWNWGAKKSVSEPRSQPVESRPINVNVMLNGLVVGSAKEERYAIITVDGVGPIIASEGDRIKPKIWLNMITDYGVLLKIANSYQWIDFGVQDVLGERFSGFRPTVGNATDVFTNNLANYDAWPRVVQEGQIVGMLINNSTANLLHIGLEAGDLMISVDAQPILSIDFLLSYLMGQKGTVELELIRNQRNIIRVLNFNEN